MTLRGDGDARYKGTVQELNMTIPYPLTAGRRQSILFPSLPDIQVGTECMKLNAVSDCGLNVSYYIKEGPAEIPATQSYLQIFLHAADSRLK